MSHRNAPLSFEGRLRLVQRCQQRPISHVAAEMGISRACASKWVNRWRRHGELGLHDRPSTPHHSPDATPAWVIERIETWRREKKWSANRITHELAELDFRINRRTVTRHLTRLGLGQRRFIDPSGHSNRKPGKIIARWPGHMAHLDVKKAGRIPRAAPGASTAATAPRSGQSTANRQHPTQNPRHQRLALIHLAGRVCGFAGNNRFRKLKLVTIGHELGTDPA